MIQDNGANYSVAVQTNLRLPEPLDAEGGWILIFASLEISNYTICNVSSLRHSLYPLALTGQLVSNCSLHHMLGSCILLKHSCNLFTPCIITIFMGTIFRANDSRSCNETDFAIITGKRLHLEKHLFTFL